MKYTPDAQADQMRKAMEKLEATVNYLNQKRREAENFGRAAYLLETMTGLDDATLKLLQLQQVHFEGELEVRRGVTDSSSAANTLPTLCAAFLFDDILLLCLRRRDQHVFIDSASVLEALKVLPDDLLANSFCIGSLLLTATNIYERDRWFKEVRERKKKNAMRQFIMKQAGKK